MALVTASLSARVRSSKGGSGTPWSAANAATAWRVPETHSGTAAKRQVREAIRPVWHGWLPTVQWGVRSPRPRSPVPVGLRVQDVDLAHHAGARADRTAERPDRASGDVL